VRLRIPARRGDEAFFSKAAETLAGELQADVEGNSATTSILIRGSDLSLERVVAAGDQKLFRLESPMRSRPSAASMVTAPISTANRKLTAVTGGLLDIPNAMFLLLIGFGIYELVRGNFKRPPWYTAFWYAFGVLSKSLLDRETT
jgi:hypothetical protein